MRRLHVWRRENVLKWRLIQVSAFNLGMRMVNTWVWAPTLKVIVSGLAAWPSRP